MVTGATTRGWASERVWLALGFGLFMVAYGGGPFGTISGTALQGVSWQSLLFIQTAFFAGVVLGCVAVRVFMRRASMQPDGMPGSVGLIAVNLFGLAMQPLLDGMNPETGVVARTLLSAIVGVFFAVPFLFWVGRLYVFGKASRHLDVVATLMCCYLVLPLAVLPCSYIAVPYGYSFVQLACAVASACMQLAYVRRNQDGSALPDRASRADVRASRQPGASVWANPEEGEGRYRLTTHSLLMLISLGVSWGVAFGSSTYGLMDVSSGGSGSGFVGAFGFMLAAVVVLWVFGRRGDIKFGFVIRLSVVVCGAVLAALPLLHAEQPMLLYPACNLAMISGEILLILFTIDICNEEGRAVGPVFTLNYIAFMLSSCLSSALFYAAQELIGGQSAWMVVSILAVWSILAVIPTMPSRSSDAAALMSHTLPEDEGYEANVAMRRERMARRYSLTEGEALVLEGLMQGKKREEIARELMLSPWTIKARASSIYKKCGVGSYKELIQLVSKD